METVELIGTLWPIFLGFVTLVIILARLWTDVEVVKEKDNVVEATTEIKLVVNGMT